MTSRASITVADNAASSTAGATSGNARLAAVSSFTSGDTVLEVRDVWKTFGRRGAGKPGGNAAASSKVIEALRGVSLSLKAGRCLGIVGESGCGKTTLARAICGLETIDSGTISVDGEVQMVFQNPVGSFDPRRTLGDGVREGMINAGIRRAEAASRAKELAELCGLPPQMLERYPREVSGGQCQRAAIARAIARNPRLLICDEATSALDVTVQKQVVELLEKLRLGDIGNGTANEGRGGLSMLFVCHDLALVSGICDEVAVMDAGQIVEQGDPRSVLSNPQHECTKRLVDAVL